MILRALVAAGRVHLRNTLARPLFQVMIVVQPVAMVLLTHYVYGGEGAARTSFFVVLGSGLAGMWMATAFSSAGDLGRERGYGTIQPVLLADVPLWVVSAGRALGALALSVVPVVVSVVVSVGVLGTALPERISVPGVLVGVAAFGVGCHAFGVLLGNLFILSRRTAVLQNLLEWPLLTVSGVLFPVTALPATVAAVSAVLPMRWGAETAWYAYNDGVLRWSSLGLALAIAAGHLLVAAMLFGVVERRIRVTASLELV
jgi:ABC-2 type transport system permease protein